jgi:hypothetical protein
VNPLEELRTLPRVHRVLVLVAFAFLVHKILVGPATVIYILTRFGWGYGLEP